MSNYTNRKKELLKVLDTIIKWYWKYYSKQKHESIDTWISKNNYENTEIYLDKLIALKKTIKKRLFQKPVATQEIKKLRDDRGELEYCSYINKNDLWRLDYILWRIERDETL